MKRFEKSFEEVFRKAMEFNVKIIAQSVNNKSKGVAPLIGDYIVNNILNPASII